MITPIPMVLHCPKCGYQHVDEGEWTTTFHRTHLCLRCKHEWRPAAINTVGILALPETSTVNQDEIILHQEIEKAQVYFGYGADDNRWRPKESAVDALIRELNDAKASRDAAENQCASAERELNALDISTAKLRAALEAVHSWIVCYAIASPEDMARGAVAIEKQVQEALATTQEFLPAAPRHPLNCLVCKIPGIIETGNVWNDRLDFQDTYAQWNCRKCNRQGPYTISSTFGTGEDWDPAAAYDAVYKQCVRELEMT